jgi:hypothetical protein
MCDNTCAYCGQGGHRAHRCPRRKHAMPWTGLDLFLATVLVALVAAGVVYA